MSEHKKLMLGVKNSTGSDASIPDHLPDRKIEDTVMTIIFSCGVTGFILRTKCLRGKGILYSCEHLVCEINIVHKIKRHLSRK